MKERRGRQAPVVGLIAVLLLAALPLLGGGCGEASVGSDMGPGYPATTVASTTAGIAVTTTTVAAYDEAHSQAGKTQNVATSGGAVPAVGALGSLTPSQHKVISNASLQIEVPSGKFQAVFEQASLLADKYGGYILSAKSNATGDESVIRSGVVAIRLPSASLASALSDASALGKVTAQQLDSQDVTEEYVDLQARLKNAQAQEEAIARLLEQAQSVEDALRVRDTLSTIQGEIEQLKGRIQYLDEHSAYATLTMSVYEDGAAVVPQGEGWGFIQALKDAARALVRTINELIVFLGGALPLLVLLALLAWIVFVFVRALRRREARASRQAYVPAPPVAAAQPASAQPAAGPAAATQAGEPVAAEEAAQPAAEESASRHESRS